MAELYNEVKMEKDKMEASKDEDAAKAEARQEFMQDACCKGKYMSMSIQERTVCHIPLVFRAASAASQSLSACLVGFLNFYLCCHTGHA